MNVSKKRREARAKRKTSARKRLHGTAARPRVSVYRSHRNIYAQVVDDDDGSTLLSAAGDKVGEVEAPKGVSGKCAAAYGVGFGWLRPEFRQQLRPTQRYWLSQQSADDLGADGDPADEDPTDS